MDEWEISKSRGHCFGTQKVIEPGQDYFAALVETEEGLQRRDYCSDHWQQQEPEVYCYWKTRLPLPNQKKQLFVDDEMLMTFFDRLAEETNEEKVSFRFVLMLILMRKRRLKYDSTKTEGDKEVWSLKVPADKRLVEVVNPHLDEEKIEQLSSQVGQILQVEL